MEELKPLKNRQLISDPVKGDCFRACITSLFRIPNTPDLPDGGQKDWWSAWHKFFSQYGLNIHYTETDIWRNGYWIASVKSQNFSDVTHSIIMHEQEVYFDPSPDTRYIEGENLLGKDVVLGGWYFEVEDFSKLYAKLSPARSEVDEKKLANKLMELDCTYTDLNTSWETCNLKLKQEYIERATAIKEAIESGEV